MPKKIIDYSNTIIYKIYCKDPAITDTHIGPTNNYDAMKHIHISSSNKPENSKGLRPLYKFIRDHGGITNWDFEILKNTYACNSLDENNYKIVCTDGGKLRDYLKKKQ